MKGIRLSKRDIRLLLIVLGALVLLGLYWFVARDYDAKTAETEKKTEELRAVLEERREYARNAALYGEATEGFVKILSGEFAQYPEYITSEDWIRYTDGFETAFSAHIPSLTWTESEERIDEFDAKRDKETAKGHYAAYKATMSASFTAGYKELKDMIDYINNDQYKTNIDSANFTFDSSTGLIACNFHLSKYALNDWARTVIDGAVEGDTGAPNPFGVIR